MSFRSRGARFSAIGAVVTLGAAASFSSYKWISESRRADTADRCAVAAEAQLRDLRKVVTREALARALEATVYADFQEVEFVPACDKGDTLVSVGANLSVNPSISSRLGGEVSITFPLCSPPEAEKPMGIPVGRATIAGAVRLLDHVGDPVVLRNILGVIHQINNDATPTDESPEAKPPAQSI